MRKSNSEPDMHEHDGMQSEDSEESVMHASHRRNQHARSLTPVPPVHRLKKASEFHHVSKWDLPEASDEAIGGSTPTASHSPRGLQQSVYHERRQVLILCTGGTMTMAADVDGSLSPVQGQMGIYLADMVELKDPKMPVTTLLEYDPLIDSSDMGPREWARIASDIEQNYLHFDGFVVICGTDTMAYAASALSFMLENLGKPVVFTGSQVPICEAHNDARRNLTAAILFAARDTFPEVMIFFDDKLLRGCRSVKMDTHGLGAFVTPNLAPLATLGVTIVERPDLVLAPPRAPLHVHLRVETRVLVVRLVPGFDDLFLRRILVMDGDGETVTAKGSPIKALIIELYGCGNLPTAKRPLIDILSAARKRGIIVVATSQCSIGGVVLGKYAVGKALTDVGVVSAGDMTTEACSTKLGYLLGRGDLTMAQVEQLVSTSLRGEISPLSALAKPVFPATPSRPHH